MKYCPECRAELVHRVKDDIDRACCPNEECGYIFWNNPTPVVAALVKNNQHYVIARNSQWPAGIFSLITGFLEGGESPEEGIIREVKEELGLDGRINRFLGLHSYHEANQLIIAFEVEATGVLSTNHEIAETMQLSANELEQYDFHPLYITENIIEQWQSLVKNAYQE